MGKFYKGFWIYALAIPAVVVIIDQLTKLWALKRFNAPYNFCETEPYKYADQVQELTPIFDLAMVCNPGISFGLLGGDSQLKRWLLTAFAAIMCLVIWNFLSKEENRLTRLSFALIIGGAIGNGIDRILNGAVTDFVHVADLLPFFPWVFNVADSAITIGVIGLIISGFFFKSDEKSA